MQAYRVTVGCSSTLQQPYPVPRSPARSQRPAGRRRTAPADGGRPPDAAASAASASGSICSSSMARRVRRWRSNSSGASGAGRAKRAQAGQLAHVQQAAAAALAGRRVV